MKILIIASLLAAGTLGGAAQSHRPVLAFTGRVVDAIHGTPLAGAFVAVVGGDSTRTASDGSFTLPNVSPEVHEMRIAQVGYPSLRIPSLLTPPGIDLKISVALRATAAGPDSTGRVPALMAIHVRPDSEAVGYAGLDRLSLSNGVVGSDSIWAVMVLKSRSAVLAYDAAGANGVICVTLKAARAPRDRC